MLMNMLLAMEKPDELSKRAIDTFESALEWMLMNIRTYNELRAHQLPRLLVRLRKSKSIPEDLKGVINIVETTWNSIVESKLKRFFWSSIDVSLAFHSLRHAIALG